MAKRWATGIKLEHFCGDLFKSYLSLYQKGKNECFPGGQIT